MKKNNEDSPQLKWNIVIFIACVAIFWGGYFIYYFCHDLPIGERRIRVIFEILDASSLSNRLENAGFGKLQIVETVERVKNSTSYNHQYVFSSIIQKNQEQIKQLNEILSRLEKQNQMHSLKSENHLTVSSLNAFYSSLFTALAVVIGVVGLVSWRTINNLTDDLKQKLGKCEYMIDDLKQQLDKFEHIKTKVDFLHKKKEYADWVRNTFLEDNDISSDKLNLKNKDRKIINEIREYMLDEISNNSWLEIILAKELFEDNNFDEAIKVFEFIELRDLLDQNRDKNNMIKPVLFHLKAQAFWKKYKIYVQLEEKAKKECLEKSIEYYKKSLDIDDSRDETHGNIALALIEYVHKYKNTMPTEEYMNKLKEAIDHLEKVCNLNKATFNTYYDLARAKYLLNSSDEITEEIKGLLFKASYIIISENSAKIFLKYLEDEAIFKRCKNWEQIKSECKSKLCNE